MPFFASMATSFPSAFTTMPRTLPPLGGSRTICVISCLSRICAPFRRALSARRRDHLARDVPLVGDEHPRHRCGVRRDDRLLDEGDTVVEQELERRHAFV